METEIIDAPTEVEAMGIDEAPVVESAGFDEGQADAVPEAVEPPANVLNLEEYNDYVVEVNGEFLPVSELKGGGLRQSDYTRKTQELAEMRRELEQAAVLDRSLKVNPKGTIEWLAQQNGMTVAQAQAAVDAQRGAQDDDYYWADEQQADPVVQRLEAIERRFQMEEAEREVENVFGRLKEKYGDDFNPQEVSNAAIEAGIYDPNMLEMVYRNLAYDKITAARQAATTQAQQQAAAQEAARKRAAQEAASATGASGSANGVEDRPAPSRNLSVREAAELAWGQLYGDQ